MISSFWTPKIDRCCASPRFHPSRLHAALGSHPRQGALGQLLRLKGFAWIVPHSKQQVRGLHQTSTIPGSQLPGLHHLDHHTKQLTTPAPPHPTIMLSEQVILALAGTQFSWSPGPSWWAAVPRDPTCRSLVSVVAPF